MLHMEKQRLKTIEKRLEKIKRELSDVGVMRPGSLTKQKQRRSSTGNVSEYWQISYTHKMKSRTDYVREGSVSDTQDQIAEYKRFKELIDEWVELAIEQAKLISKASVK